METNFEKMLQSMKQYIDDQDDKSSPIDHEHAQYVKRNSLANVAYTGSYYDLLDIPDLRDSVTKEELEEILQSLENQDTSLDDALKLFEKSVELSKICFEKIKQTQGKVEIIKKELDEIKVQNFDDIENK